MDPTSRLLGGGKKKSATDWNKIHVDEEDDKRWAKKRSCEDTCTFLSWPEPFQLTDSDLFEPYQKASGRYLLIAVRYFAGCVPIWIVSPESISYCFRQIALRGYRSDDRDMECCREAA